MSMKKMLICMLLSTQMLFGAADSDKKELNIVDQKKETAEKRIESLNIVNQEKNTKKNVAYASIRSKGGREYDEDRYSNDAENGVFAVYDGALGARIAALADKGFVNEKEMWYEFDKVIKVDHIWKGRIVSDQEDATVGIKVTSLTDLVKVAGNEERIKNAFVEFDNKLREAVLEKIKFKNINAKTQEEKEKKNSWTRIRNMKNMFFLATAAAVLVKINSNDIYYASAGDSRAIGIDKDGKVVFSTVDHTLRNQKEFDRIKKIVDSFNLEQLKLKSERGKTLLLEELQKAKSTLNGFKDNERLIDHYLNFEHTRHLGGSHLDQYLGVTAEPETGRIDRAKVAFIVLASDGLWDVVNNEEVAQIVKNAFDSGEGNDEGKAETAAFKLQEAAKTAWKKDNYDNTTITVIKVN